MSEPELRPCPFCGSPGEYQGGDGKMLICCSLENCPVRPVLLPHPLQTKAEMFATWNKRHLPGAPPFHFDDEYSSGFASAFGSQGAQS